MWQEFYNWITGNKEWFFDGLGVVLVTGLVTFIFKNFQNKKQNDSAPQSQTGGDNSTNVQVGRDLNISKDKEGKNVRKKKSNRR